VLSAENKKQLMVPHGFAHGFSVLSETTSVLYKVDQVYHKESERGIRYDDATLNIDWQLAPEEVIVSEKDLVLPGFDGIDFLTAKFAKVMQSAQSGIGFSFMNVR
jgi:dTDP-4-dehydrorhamnose 3,5-epimerase